MVRSAARPRRIGIFGGSFNPVHNGHLRLAAQTVNKLGLWKVFFVPTRLTPLKDNAPLLPVRSRVRLLRAALRGKPRFGLCLYEARRPGRSFTIRTVRYFRRRFGRSAELYFLAGADVLRNLSRWKCIDEMLELCRFTVFDRPGFGNGKCRYPVMFLRLNALSISSSRIREELKKGKPIARWMPPGTAEDCAGAFARLWAGMEKGGSRSIPRRK